MHHQCSHFLISCYFLTFCVGALSNAVNLNILGTYFTDALPKDRGNVQLLENDNKMDYFFTIVPKYRLEKWNLRYLGEAE